MDSNSDLAQFCQLTNTTPDIARQFLAGSDLQTALASYYATLEDDDVEEEGEEEEDEDEGERDAGPSRPTTTTTSGGRFATLDSMRSREDDDDSEDEAKKPTEFFTGGEKSGLAVQNPDRNPPTGNNVIDEILRQAQRTGEAPPKPPTTEKKSSAFTGSGMTLGSEDTPSISIPDASSTSTSRSRGPRTPMGFRPGSAAAMGEAIMRSGAVGGVSSEQMDRLIGGMPGGFPSRGNSRDVGGQQSSVGDAEEESEDDGEPVDQVAIRTLTFWKDGFSLGDGPLLSYQDAMNKQILESIKNGQAPRSLLKVKLGQMVEMRVAKRLDENYIPPPTKPKKPFHGAGNRLGSPASEMRGTVSTGGASSMAATKAMEEVEEGARATGGGGATGTVGGFNLDQNAPQTSIQVRLADGTKLVARLNLTHTIGDIRHFITASQPAGRPFLIQTTFPSKVLEDDSQTVEQAGLANAVIVQRWT